MRRSQSPCTTRPRLLSTTFLLILAASMVGVGCGNHEVDTPAPGSAVSVQTVLVERAGIASVVEGVGSLHGAREAVLSAKVMGTVIEIRKHAGESVRRGEVLVVLDDREVAGNIGQAEGALAQARAAAALAESNLKRFEQLRQRGAASQLELDQARFAHETAAGAVRQAEAAVSTAGSYESYAQIPAPFDGQVVDRLVEVGDLAAPGRPLMRVEDGRRLRLHVTLAESQAMGAATGGPVEVIVPSLEGRSFAGTVAEVVPAVDPATRTQLVKIDLPADSALRSGLFARARFTIGTRDALSIPARALVRRGGLSGVFVAENGHAAFRLVELAEAQSGDSIEVLAGLESGAVVVVDAPATLTEGAAIEVRP